MEKRKILVVNTTDMGYTGISSVIMNYFDKTYNDVRYDFVLCGSIESDISDKLKKYYCNIFIPPCSRVRKPLVYHAWLKKLIKDIGYDVIHVHGNSGTMFFEIDAAKRASVPVRIAHCHSTSCKYKWAHRILKPFLNLELTHAIACSDMAGEWLYTKNYEILPNGIDVDRFAFSAELRDEYRNNLGIGDKLAIGHVANMNTEKNHMFLIDVFELIVKERQDVCLLLIGDGVLRAEIEAYIGDRQLNQHIMVLGKRSDVAQLYQCMDIFVLPSLFEGLPVSLVEAQCSGLPCVVSNRVTEQVNVTKNIVYLGIEDRDKVLWKNVILDTIAHTGNIERMGGADVLRASAFSIDCNAVRLMEFYN